MSDTKHTRAPWSLSAARTVEDYTMIVAGEGDDFGLVASVTLDADARLIAAAPDLLDALRRCAAILPQYHMMGKTMGDDEVHSQVLEDVEAAIAKAEPHSNEGK